MSTEGRYADALMCLRLHHLKKHTGVPGTDRDAGQRWPGCNTCSSAQRCLHTTDAERPEVGAYQLLDEPAVRSKPFLVGLQPFEPESLAGGTGSLYHARSVPAASGVPAPAHTMTSSTIYCAS